MKEQRAAKLLAEQATASKVAALMHDLRAARLREQQLTRGAEGEPDNEPRGAARQRDADALRARATLGRYLLRWYRATML